jgi:hypothetical protein
MIKTSTLCSAKFLSQEDSKFVGFFLQGAKKTLLYEKEQKGTNLYARHGCI